MACGPCHLLIHFSDSNSGSHAKRTDVCSKYITKQTIALTVHLSAFLYLSFLLTCSRKWGRRERGVVYITVHTHSSHTEITFLWHTIMRARASIHTNGNYTTRMWGGASVHSLWSDTFGSARSRTLASKPFNPKQSRITCTPPTAASAADNNNNDNTNNTNGVATRAHAHASTTTKTAHAKRRRRRRRRPRPRRHRGTLIVCTRCASRWLAHAFARKKSIIFSNVFVWLCVCICVCLTEGAARESGARFSFPLRCHWEHIVKRFEKDSGLRRFIERQNVGGFIALECAEMCTARKTWHARTHARDTRFVNMCFGVTTKTRTQHETPICTHTADWPGRTHARNNTTDTQRTRWNGD